MSQPFIAQITMFAGNFAPRDWAFCSGQLISINQNTALFSLVGTTYGGDGRTTFGLPDLRGRCPIGSEGNSAGPGLTARPLGQRAGTETVTLNANQIPSHSHTTTVTGDVGNSKSPVGAIPATSNDGENNFSTDLTNSTSQITSNTGGNQSHNNMPPYLAINFIIALQGLFPSRN